MFTSSCRPSKLDEIHMSWKLKPFSKLVLCCMQEWCQGLAIPPGPSLTSLLAASTLAIFGIMTLYLSAQMNRAAERSDKGGKFPQGLKLQGPHNTQYFKVWGSHQVNQQ